MSVWGDMVIQGSVRHQGKLALYHGLSANHTFEATSGSLQLAGLDQLIRVDNTSLSSISVNGGGTKQLKGRLIVGSKLSLLEGILQTDESSQLTLAPSAQIQGGSANAYVDGFLYHSGTGKKFYPVGKNGAYAPATLLNVTGDAPTVGVAYFPTSAIAGPEFHWHQRAINGTYGGSTAQLTFSTGNADYQKYSPELVVLAADENTDAYTVLGQSSLAIGGNQFTITSDLPTAQSLLSVGFDIPEDSKHLYLPNAFSPTAPHVEDRYIKVYGQKISAQNFYLAIQDMWGAVVYQTTSWEEASTRGWQGPTNASPVAATYRYLLEGQYIGGKRFQKTGTIIQY